jgi:hypothetical protein
MRGIRQAVLVTGTCLALIGCGSSATLPSPLDAPTRVVPSSSAAVASQPIGTSAPHATPVAGTCGPIPASSGEDRKLPWGEYSTGPVPMAKIIAALKADGLHDVEATLTANGYDLTKTKTITTILCFVQGQYASYQQNNNGSVDFGSEGVYAVTGDHALQLSFPEGGQDHVSFSITGDQLTFTDWKSGDGPNSWSQWAVSIYAASPYTRHP